MSEKMPEKISACRDPQLKVCRWTEAHAAPMACETQYIRLDKHQAELAALKAAVRDMAGALTNNLDYRTCLPREVGEEFRNVLTKHAALIGAEGE